jgi:hypothetical protein
MYSCWALLVSLGAGFVVGLLGSIFANGVRRMLAPVILRRKLSAGSVLKSEEDKLFPFWYIPVHVKAHTMWNLLVSSIEDVRATVVFIARGSNGEVRRPFHATWVEPDIDDSSISLRIGGQYRIRVATVSSGVLKPIGSIEEDSLLGDQDITIKLRSGATFLGHWKFPNAITQGSMQQVSPTNISKNNVNAE